MFCENAVVTSKAEARLSRSKTTKVTEDLNLDARALVEHVAARDRRERAEWGFTFLDLSTRDLKGQWVVNLEVVERL